MALTIHEPFHRSPSNERALFGAFGSGKSYAGVDEAIAWMLEMPGIRGLAARQTIPELRDTLEPIFLQRTPPDLLDASEVRRTAGHLDHITFPNGSRVMFRSLDDPQKHRSLNLGFFLIDEANEVDEETYMFMRGRLRQSDPTAEAVKRGYTAKITRRGSWVMTNPSGHDWMWRRFVNPASSADGTDYFKSTSLDNAFLPPEYLETLFAFPRAWVERYVLCSFDDFSGQVYEDWSQDHVVPARQYPYPAGGLVWMGMDPGTRNPTAGLWVHVDQPRRRLVGIAEYQATNLAATRHAAAWRTIEAQHQMAVRRRISDPGSLPVRDRGSNMSLQDQYRREGFNFQLGPKLPKDRVPMLGLLIAQKRFLLTDACPQTAEQIQEYRWEEITTAMKRGGKDAPEKPVKGGDDLVDCAQYVSSQWISPEAVHPKLPVKEGWAGESEQIWRKTRQQINRQRARLTPAPYSL